MSGDPFTTVFNTFINHIVSKYYLEEVLKIRDYYDFKSGDDYIVLFRNLI